MLNRPSGSGAPPDPERTPVLEIQAPATLSKSAKIVELPPDKPVSAKSIRLNLAEERCESAQPAASSQVTPANRELSEASFTDAPAGARPEIAAQTDDPRSIDVAVCETGGEEGEGGADSGQRPLTAASPPSASKAPQDTVALPNFASNLEGALWWFGFGYKVIPIVPAGKWPALGHHPWLDTLSAQSIRAHWNANPTHQVGAILDEDQIVLDADTPAALDALVDLEKRFGIEPHLVIKTSRGFHHHFRLTAGAFAKADSHSTAQFPDRIDVRAGRNSALLTPSHNKSVELLQADNRDGLTAVGQDFVDAVFQHNGRPAPRPTVEPDEREAPPAKKHGTDTLSKLLDVIDPDCGYQEWLSVLMAVFHETSGSPAGLELAVAWSSKGKSFNGRAEIETKWRSFSGDVATPVTIATLIARARDAGADVGSIMADDFEAYPAEVCVTEVVAQSSASAAKPSPFVKYSLQGQSAKYQDAAQAAKPLLGDVCLSGEATIWYAKPNTGKTLLLLHLALEAIEHGRIAAENVFYINADDSSSGLAEKLGLIDEVGAHMLVPGQAGFKAGDFEELLTKAAANGTARGILVAIDTVKKFVDLMNKRQTSEFGAACRQFVSAGGTLVGLAHTNKNRNEAGKLVHAGTSDILDDFDAGYLIDEVASEGDTGEKLVSFERIKSRSGGVQTAAYGYAANDGISYGERLASVRVVDPDDFETLKRIEEVRSDSEVVDAVLGCIDRGINTKMALRNAVADQAGISRRAATRVIERYTGDDPSEHRWIFARKARGALTYSALRTAHADRPDGSLPTG